MVLVLVSQAFPQIVQRLSIGKRWQGAVKGCQHVRIGFCCLNVIQPSRSIRPGPQRTASHKGQDSTLFWVG